MWPELTNQMNAAYDKHLIYVLRIVLTYNRLFSTSPKWYTTEGGDEAGESSGRPTNNLDYGV
jgi:hypothetical protein